MLIKSLLAVDPGVVLGWAFWLKNRKYPVRCGVIKPCKHSKNFFQNIRSSVHQLDEVILELRPVVVACEWPAFFGSVGGRAAAGSGSIVKLTFGVGQIALIADSHGIEFVPVKINKWKGQLSKEIVIKRINKILPVSRLKYLKPESHAYDAIGIGLYCRGLF